MIATFTNRVSGEPGPAQGWGTGRQRAAGAPRPDWLSLWIMGWSSRVRRVIQLWSVMLLS
jgi:hypothetical protein